MTVLDDALGDYLAVRRAVGFKLAGQDRLLADFVGFIHQRGEQSISIPAALVWAGQGGTAGSRARRLGLVRVFARYAQAFDPASEVPPARLLGPARRRLTPYLFAENEIVAVMDIARRLRPGLWGQTCATVIGLLWSTGLRVGEALRLERVDVSLDDALVTVWRSKGQKSREVPLSATTANALAAYVQLRDQHWPTVARLFVDPDGGPVAAAVLNREFARLLSSSGVPSIPPPRPPRLADLRHGFAVRTLIGWHDDGQDVQALLPRLSTYLGHTGPASTYWYLHAAPELLSRAAGRLQAGQER